MRCTFPGSTWAPQDTLENLIAEYRAYPMLAQEGVVDGLCSVEAPEKAYVLWSNGACAEAIVVMIWCEPSMRESITGTLLLNSAAAELGRLGIKKLRYLVSVQNSAAIKMLGKSGFRKTHYVVNKRLA